MPRVIPPSDRVEEIVYRGSEVTSMCPATAMGLRLAQKGELSEDVVATVRQVIDIMTELAHEERRTRLAQLDERIAASRERRRIEGE